MNHLPLLLSALLAAVTGTLTDKTTGQPLTGVTISTSAGAKTIHAKTDAHGHFNLGKLPAGTYTLHLSSPDVPAESLRVRVRGASTNLHIKACSTTLDYSCAGPGGPGGG